MTDGRIGSGIIGLVLGLAVLMPAVSPSLAAVISAVQYANMRAAAVGDEVKLRDLNVLDPAASRTTGSIQSGSAE